jgi:hypothetical protein
MTHLEGSTSQRPRPCAAEVGNAWWLLWNASPIESGVSHSRLRDSSFVANFLRPKKWHSELIEYVTWWSTRTRTAPPHSMPVRPSRSVPPNAQPRKNGAARPPATQRTNLRSTALTTGSAIRSGA